MSTAGTDAQRAVAATILQWATKAAPLGDVRAQEADPERWRANWPALADLGVFSAAIGEAAGGAGGSVADLAAILEQAAASLVPGPIVTTVLAGLLLSRASSSLANELLPSLADGKLTAGIALGPTSLTGRALVATPGPAGGFIVHGTVSPVLGADRESICLAPARVGDTDTEIWFVLPAGTPGLSVTALPAADFSRPLGALDFDEVALPAAHVLAELDGSTVLDLAVTLFAAEAAGIAGWALRTAVDYARLREQFGRPIGSFQAIKHLCAEMLCRVEQATAVAWDAARAAGEPDQLPLAAAVAGSMALDAAVDTAKDCIQVLGGIGFTWEHDAHLYLRRALALRQLVGGSDRWRRRAAELSLSGVRRQLRVELGAEADAERFAIRARAERIAALPDSDQRRGLVEAGYLAPHWPPPNGLSASPAQQLMIDEELDRAGVVRPDLVIGAWAVPTIIDHGTAEQVERFVGPTLRGEIVWCQLFSEPGAGSDLAALSTKAEKVDGGWRLQGQKVWTSLARQADWAICLARTDASVAKHRGISYFLVDMRSAGIDIRPLREITGEAVFNEVFLDGAFVADDQLVGELNGGWKLARATLASERVAMGGGSSIGDAVEQLLALAVTRGASSDPLLLQRLGALVSDGAAGSLLELRSTMRRLDGLDAGAESSVRKLVGVRHRQAVAEAALQLLAADGAVTGPEMHQFLLSRCLTIAGGTTQVLLTLAAERLLGLPREPS